MSSIYVMPRSRFGVWSLMLGVGFVLLQIVFSVLLASGQRGGATFWSNPLLTVPMVGAGVCAAAAGISAAIALTLKRDRAVVLLITLLLGLFVIFFAAASASSRLEVGVAAVLIFGVPIILWRGRSHRARVGLTTGAVLATIALMAYAAWVNQPTPIPADRQAFVGVWNADSEFRIEIRQDGTAGITQNRGAAVFKDLGIQVAPSVVETANIQFKGNQIHVYRPTYEYGRDYRIDRAPFAEDGRQKMVLNGVTLVKE